MHLNQNNDIDKKKLDRPDVCPNCGHRNRGRVSCTKCGIYFFMYYKGDDNPEEKEGSNLESIHIYQKNILGRIQEIYIIYFILVLIVLMLLINPYNLIDLYKNNSKPGVDTAGGVESGKTVFRKGLKCASFKDIIGASKHFKKAQLIFEQTDDEKSMILSEMNLAICLRYLKKYPEAMALLDRVVEFAKKSENQQLQAKALREKGILKYYLQQFDSSILDLEDAFYIHKDIKEDAAISDCTIIGSIEREYKQNMKNRCFDWVATLCQGQESVLSGYKMNIVIENTKKGATKVIRSALPEFEYL